MSQKFGNIDDKVKATDERESKGFENEMKKIEQLSALYQIAQDSELLTLYKELATDDTPMVRRGAAKHLGSFLQQVGYDNSLTPAIRQTKPRGS